MTDSTGSKGPARRSRWPLVVLAVLAAAGVGALALVYVAFFTDDSPSRLALTDQPATGGPGTAAPTAAGVVGTWRAAAGSEAGYRVREKLASLPAQSDAVGRSRAVTGTVKVEAVGGSIVASGATFKVDLTRLASDEGRRDNRIRTQGLQTDTFPEATFVSTGNIVLPAETTSGEAVKARAEGDLTIHGVTKRVTIPIEVRLTGGKGELVGSLSFPMSDFAITPPSIGGFVTVEPDATLEFKLVLEKA